MTRYAHYDHTATQPATVDGWYDTEVVPLSAYSSAPATADLLEITDAQWKAHLEIPFGWTVQSGTLIQPAQATALSTAQAKQAATIKAACSAAISAGFASSVTGSACTYPLSDTDQTNLGRAYNLALLAESTATTWAASTTYAINAVVKTSGDAYYLCTTAGTSGTAAPTWPTAFATGITDGTVVWKLAGYEIQTETGYAWHTPAQVIALYLAEAAFISTSLSKCQTLLDEISAATTAAAVQAIVWG